MSECLKSLTEKLQLWLMIQESHFDCEPSANERRDVFFYWSLLVSCGGWPGASLTEEGIILNILQPVFMTSLFNDKCLSFWYYTLCQESKGHVTPLKFKRWQFLQCKKFIVRPIECVWFELVQVWFMVLLWFACSFVIEQPLDKFLCCCNIYRLLAYNKNPE